jgi:hypothetical protein
MILMSMISFGGCLEVNMKTIIMSTGKSEQHDEFIKEAAGKFSAYLVELSPDNFNAMLFEMDTEEERAAFAAGGHVMMGELINHLTSAKLELKYHREELEDGRIKETLTFS